LLRITTWAFPVGSGMKVVAELQCSKNSLRTSSSTTNATPNPNNHDHHYLHFKKKCKHSPLFASPHHNDNGWGKEKYFTFNQTKEKP